MTERSGRPAPLVPRDERSLVVVVPHPDDEGFAAGGTIARFAAAGVPVTVLCGTLGQLGRRFGSPPVANRESLPGVRAREMREACRILGCEHEFLGMFDRMLEFEDPEHVAEAVRARLASLAPSTVITFHPAAGAHPDHEALAVAAVCAVRALPPPRPRLLGVAVGTRAAVLVRLGPPDVVCEVRAFLDRKNRALRAHASQTAELFAPGSAEPRGPRTERYDMGGVEGFYTLEGDGDDAT